MLNVNKTIEAFLSVSSAIFPAILNSKNSKQIIELALFLSSNPEKLEVKQDIENSHSKILCSVETFFVCLLPILCSNISSNNQKSNNENNINYLEEKNEGKNEGKNEEKKSGEKIDNNEKEILTKVNDIVYNLLCFQSMIKNQVLSLSKFILPKKINIDNMTIGSDQWQKTICLSFIKQLQTIQVFEISSGLLDSIQWIDDKNNATLRVILDKANGIDLDTIVEATNIINPILDEADLIEEGYTLEVSSKERGN